MHHTSMTKFLVAVAVVVVLSACSIGARPYHSTQGVLHTRPSLNDFLTTYLQAAQKRAEPQYGYAEYQPSYQQGYISHQPRRTRQNLEPLMQYLSSPDLQSQDYSNYDLPNSDSVYTDSDGDWYDNPSAPQALIGGPSYASQSSGDFLDNEPTEQDLALFQLMLDHIAGKYSLEDLETLEREARIEENTENQLRALTKKVHHKKAMRMPYMAQAISRGSAPQLNTAPRRVVMTRIAPRMPVSGGRGPSEGLLSMSQRRGQKEEPVMVPATSVRRPVFVQQLEQNAPNLAASIGSFQQNMDKKVVQLSPVASTKSSATTTTSKSGASSSSSSPTAAPRSSGVVEVVKVTHKTQLSDSPSTITPYVQSAYEAFKKYLDTERQARINSDQELFRSPQKRFVQDSDPLPRELNNLKKSIA